MNRDNEKIDVTVLFFDFLRVLKKMWIHIVVLTLVCALILGIQANIQYQERYTAYTSFTVNIWDRDMADNYLAYYDNAAAEQLAESFPYILTSGVLQRKVAADMGTEGISGSINASVLENTNIFTLSVTDTDPKRAQKTLKAVIRNYPSVSEAVVGKLDMHVLDESGVPTEPDNPKDLSSDVTKGAIIGFAIGLAWAVMVTLMRKTIRCEEDCRKHINQRCLGSVPFVKMKERSSKNKQQINITKKNIHPEFKEAIRMIRNKVKRYTEEGHMKRIIITSALASEGKSTMAVNLAISLAQEGKAVTLIDCDLRNPSDGEIMNIDRKVGLSDYLNGNANLQDCVLTADFEKANKERIRFRFIPGGPAIADGSTLLGSDEMKKAINLVSKDSDYVILDSAPVGLLTDASVLAQYADCAMFVVKKDFAKAQHILDGIEHLSESGVPVIGCILNGD